QSHRRKCTDSLEAGGRELLLVGKLKKSCRELVSGLKDEDERLRRFVDLLEIHRFSLVAEKAHEFPQHFFGFALLQDNVQRQGPVLPQPTSRAVARPRERPKASRPHPSHPTMRAPEPQFCVRLSHRPHPSPGRSPLPRGNPRSSHEWSQEYRSSVCT